MSKSYLPINIEKKDVIINKKKDKFNVGLNVLPFVLFMLYFFFARVLLDRLRDEINNPTLPGYVVNFLNTGSNAFFLVYGLGFIAFLIFFWDFKADKHFNLIGLIVAFSFILSYAFGFTSILTYLIGVVMLFVSLI